MRLYLDDNTAGPLMARLLQNAGHDVAVPLHGGTAGEDDSVHLTFAINNQRVCVTEDHGDFGNLHNLLMVAGGHHPGILLVRRDNDPKKDMFPRDVVRAIRNLENAGVPIQDQCIILNHWR